MPNKNILKRDMTSMTSHRQQQEGTCNTIINTTLSFMNNNIKVRLPSTGPTGSTVSQS